MQKISFKMSAMGVLASIFIFLMLFAPYQLQPVKAVFLIFIFILVCSKIASERSVFLCPQIGFLLLMCMAVGFFSFARGLYFGAPGAMRSETVMLLWPFVFTILISAIRTVDHLVLISKIIVISTLLTCFFIGVFLLQSMAFVPHVIPDFMGKLNFANYNGYVQVVIPQVFTLVCVTPFIISLLMCKREGSFLSKKNIGFVLFFCILCALLSGRRALLVILPAAYIWIVFVGALFEKERAYLLKRALFLIIILLCVTLIAPKLFSIFNVTGANTFNYALTSFNFTDNASNQIRVTEFYPLLEGWLQHPFLGSGQGAALTTITRSATQPWDYELFYMQLLFQMGLLGFLTYAIAILWLFKKSFEILKKTNNAIFKNITLAGMTSLFFFLIANLGDPYFGIFDANWVLFFQVAVVNLWVIKEKELS